MRSNVLDVGSLASFPSMMESDRKREGLRVCRAAWLVGVSVREYRQIEAGTGPRAWIRTDGSPSCSVAGDVLWPTSPCL
jgi:hypothetical protein